MVGWIAVGVFWWVPHGGRCRLWLLPVVVGVTCVANVNLRFFPALKADSVLCFVFDTLAPTIPPPRSCTAHPQRPLSISPLLHPIHETRNTPAKGGQRGHDDRVCGRQLRVGGLRDPLPTAPLGKAGRSVRQKQGPPHAIRPRAVFARRFPRVCVPAGERSYRYDIMK